MWPMNGRNHLLVGHAKEANVGSGWPYDQAGDTRKTEGRGGGGEKKGEKEKICIKVLGKIRIPLGILVESRTLT